MDAVHRGNYVGGAKVAGTRYHRGRCSNVWVNCYCAWHEDVRKRWVVIARRVSRTGRSANDEGIYALDGIRRAVR